MLICRRDWGRHPCALAADPLLATVEECVVRFVRSEFRRSPTDGWTEQWRELAGVFFRFGADQT